MRWLLAWLKRRKAAERARLQREAESMYRYATRDELHEWLETGRLPSDWSTRSDHICANCEYFDGGGERAVQNAIKIGVSLHGDCLNRSSPRFQTYSNDTCPVWTATT